MNFSLQAFLGTAACLVLSLMVGFALATGNHFLLMLGTGAALLAAVMVSEGFAGLIAFGLLCPFVLPVPFVRGVPFLASVLVLCALKYLLRSAVRRSDVQSAVWLLTPGIAAFFLWVVIRYAMDPVLPNLKGFGAHVTGFGAHVTGFRAYLGYATCAGLVLLLGATINTRAQLSSLLRWLGIISAALTAMFIPLVFSRSPTAAALLSQFGVFVTTFDSGFLRFVVLPGYGMFLVMLAALPKLCRPTPALRLALFGLGLVAVILGGSRSSFLMLMVMLLCVAALRLRALHTLAFGSGFAMLLVIFYLIGEHIQIREVGLLRILSLVSPRIANQTDAADSVRWRLARWERAAADIQQRPWVGKGYGGLENAWVFQTRADYEAAMVDVDVAAGSVHNGYLAATRAFGIPAIVFFLLLLGWHLNQNFQRARRLRYSDPLASDVHLLALTYIMGYFIAIQFGSDLNDPMIWFGLGLGLLMRRIKAHEVTLSATSEPARLALAQPAPAA